MNNVRYYIALLLLMFVPPAFLFWFSVHPLIRFWRTMELRLSLTIHYGGVFMLAALIFAIRKPLLSVEFGTNPILIGLAVPLLVAAVVMRKKFAKYLKFGILTGVPELSPERHKTGLLTAGAYARIRHPRYVQYLLSIMGYALFCNYLATYLLVPAVAISIYPIVLMEERELRSRFGAEYEAYCARVPRFVPKLRK
jgi:protein-S-isoprenylcysteine O-methyltransferase Ste14